MKIEAIVKRSVADFFYIIYTLYQLRRDLKKNAMISLWLIFVVDLIAVLPVPQLLVIYADPEHFLFAFHFLLILLVLRTIRMFPLFRKMKLKDVEEIIFALAVFFYSFVDASGVFGGLWYFLAVKRETACWEKALKVRPGDYKYLNDLCCKTNSNYNFGIFQEALTSGIADAKTAESLKKSVYCFRWGLQSLSGFGNGLQASTDKEENIFVLSITLVGVLLLVVSIGLVQMIIDNYVTSIRETASKKKEIKHKLDQWKPLERLSDELKKKIKKSLPGKMQKTTDVNLENVLNNLTEELKRKAKQQLFLPLLQQIKVKEFSERRKDLLEELCKCAKPVSYTAREHHVQIGDPVNEMMFVVQGELWTYTTADTTAGPEFLKVGDFCGKELVAWLQNSPSANSLIPTSNRAIQALTKVDAFALTACDLRKAYAEQMSPTPAAEPRLNASGQRQVSETPSRSSGWFNSLKQFLFPPRARSTTAEEA
ncbi:Cyclic nucleotide-gated ion channel 1 [Melia azedarach]|uniref:Cyclic nucleotide-gated ion channel 1 n=1 Tax=Melia azedarach TaxID=155640 RepID=A0ACC1X5E2_MELAZ|nr:Cyclic nucleotide-gated ion channel 1 [Melia azedarach]